MFAISQFCSQLHLLGGLPNGKVTRVLGNPNTCCHIWNKQEILNGYREVCFSIVLFPT